MDDAKCLSQSFRWFDHKSDDSKLQVLDWRIFFRLQALRLHTQHIALLPCTTFSPGFVQNFHRISDIWGIESVMSWKLWTSIGAFRTCGWDLNELQHFGISDVKHVALDAVNALNASKLGCLGLSVLRLAALLRWIRWWTFRVWVSSSGNSTRRRKLKKLGEKWGKRGWER